jgi:hypothetical protein
MRDVEILKQAIEEAQSVLHEYVEPGPRNPEMILQRMLDILDRVGVVEAQKRLSRGYGQLRVVK